MHAPTSTTAQVGPLWCTLTLIHTSHSWPHRLNPSEVPSSEAILRSAAAQQTPYVESWEKLDRSGSKVHCIHTWQQAAGKAMILGVRVLSDCKSTRGKHRGFANCSLVGIAPCTVSHSCMSINQLRRVFACHSFRSQDRKLNMICRDENF